MEDERKEAQEMRRMAAAALVVVCVAAAWCRPVCRTVCLNDMPGMSGREIRRAVQDSSGFIWIGALNGLYRYDGYELAYIAPADSAGNPITFGRLNSISLMATGNLFCRIDDRCAVFDVATCRFHDIHSAIEKQAGKRIAIDKLLPTADGCTVLKCKDSSAVTVRDASPTTTAVWTVRCPDKEYVGVRRYAYETIGGIRRAETVYSGRDRYGTIWVIRRDGTIWYTSAENAPLTRAAARIDIGKDAYCCLIDTEGGVWISDTKRMWRVGTGQTPYDYLPQETATEVRCAYTDKTGTTWIGARDGAIWTTTRDGAPARYLTPDGRLARGYTRFFDDAAAYCMCEDASGSLWIGSKPGGLYRLRKKKDGTYDVTRFRRDRNDSTTISANNIYDIVSDSDGRLWIATMSGGVNCVEDVAADKPVFIHRGNGLPRYPEEGWAVIRLAIVRDSVLLAATTKGLAAAAVRGKRPADMTFALHTLDDGQPANIAGRRVMDIAADDAGYVYVATESAGICRIAAGELNSPAPAFTRLRRAEEIPDDFIKSMTWHDGRLWIVCAHSVQTYSPRGGEWRSYGTEFWKEEKTFSEARPIQLRGGQWLFGVTDGALTLSADSIGTGHGTPRIALTAVTTGGRRDNVAVDRADTLFLTEDERDIVVRYAALMYDDAAGVSYACKTDGGEWTSVGRARALSLFDMSPGTHHIAIRSTNVDGTWADNSRTLTIVVAPHWWETAWARAIALLVAIALVIAVAHFFASMRKLKKKQRETLEAYMRTLDEKTRQALAAEGAAAARACLTAGGGAAGGSGSLTAGDGRKTTLNKDEEAFMKRVMDYIEANIRQTEITVDDLASAAAVSPSGLNRKMKHITGSSPGEFVRQLKIRRATTLLTTTDSSVMAIALDCGFNDQNYFARYFKKKTGLTPTDYRRQHARQTTEGA